MATNKNTRDVYMLEHDPDDREITEVIGREAGYDVTFTFFSDADQFFEGLSQAKDLPAVIVLDYNLAGSDIISVLNKLKASPKYLHIPVVVLSESASPHALTEIYQHGAASLITKPFSNNDTVNKISGFLNYWFNVVELPGNGGRQKK